MSDPRAILKDLLQERLDPRLEAVETKLNENSSNLTNMIQIVENLTLKLSVLPIQIAEKSELLEKVRNPTIKQPRPRGRQSIASSKSNQSPAKSIKSQDDVASPARQNIADIARNNSHRDNPFGVTAVKTETDQYVLHNDSFEAQEADIQTKAEDKPTGEPVSLRIPVEAPVEAGKFSPVKRGEGSQSSIKSAKKGDKKKPAADKTAPKETTPEKTAPPRQDTTKPAENPSPVEIAIPPKDPLKPEATVPAVVEPPQRRQSEQPVANKNESGNLKVMQPNPQTQSGVLRNFDKEIEDIEQEMGADNFLLDSSDDEKAKAQDPTPDLEEVKEEEDQSPGNQELKLLNEQIEELLAIAGEAKCQQKLDFTLSLGAKSAVTLLHTININQFTEADMNGDVVWCFRLLFQMAGEKLPETDEEAWEACKQLLLSTDRSLSEKMNEKFNRFEFSDENIDLLEKLAEGNRHKIDPAYFNQFNAMASFLMFALKDAAEFAGLVPEKRTPWRHYSRLTYKRDKLLG